MLVVLVQNPKGGGLSSAFGGDGGNMLAGGVRRTNDFLEKSTWTLALALLALVLLVNITNPSVDVDSTPESQVDEEIDNAAPSFQPPISQPSSSPQIQASDIELPESAE
tara:strand:- start:37163 stop:37489 length:327 start_codon:yes stop_codon:yes gene_type:complete